MGKVSMTENETLYQKMSEGLTVAKLLKMKMWLDDRTVEVAPGIHIEPLRKHVDSRVIPRVQIEGVQRYG